MSEYQYYEFRAIDRPLAEKEMRTLRSYSTRAVITPTSFTNHYEWGNFKGDPDAWMDKYFDAFLYFANWGTRIAKLRLPSTVLPLETVEQYCPGEYFSARVKAGNVILSLVSEDEEQEDEFYSEDDCLSSLVPIRAELAGGDFRALYLGWLLAVQAGEVDDDETEPPVPPGLDELSLTLQTLAGFLGLNCHLLTAAAQASGKAVDETQDREAIIQWVTKLDPREKDDVLVTLITGERSHLGSELLARFRRERRDEAASTIPRRTVRELKRLAEEHRQKTEARAAQALARRKREVEAARLKYIDGLAGQETELWATVEKLIATRQPNRYDEAVRILTDLRDLSENRGREDFTTRLQRLRAKHAHKPSLLTRLKKLGHC